MIFFMMSHYFMISHEVIPERFEGHKPIFLSCDWNYLKSQDFVLLFVSRVWNLSNFMYESQNGGFKKLHLKNNFQQIFIGNISFQNNLLCKKSWKIHIDTYFLGSGYYRNIQTNLNFDLFIYILECKILILTKIK